MGRVRIETDEFGGFILRSSIDFAGIVRRFCNNFGDMNERDQCVVSSSE